MLYFYAYGEEKNPREAEFWLKGASYAGVKIDRIDMKISVKDFILMLEDLNAIPQVQDLWWLNKLCKHLLGREYTPSSVKYIIEHVIPERLAMEKSGTIKNVDRTKSKR